MIVYIKIRQIYKVFYMNQVSGRKNKINLNDYPFQQDIEFRLMMSELTVFEVNLIQEILNNSLKIPIIELQKAFKKTHAELMPVLEKLTRLKLYKIEKDALEVNKERRKYYEAHIAKFDESFNPDMEYLKNLLSKVISRPAAMVPAIQIFRRHIPLHRRKILPHSQTISKIPRRT